MLYSCHTCHHDIFAIENVFIIFGITDCSLHNTISCCWNPNLNLSSIAFDVDTLQWIIIGVIISSWAYQYLSSLNHSDPYLLYLFLICSSVGFLVVYLPWISFLIKFLCCQHLNHFVYQSFLFRMNILYLLFIYFHCINTVFSMFQEWF